MCWNKASPPYSFTWKSNKRNPTRFCHIQNHPILWCLCRTWCPERLHGIALLGELALLASLSLCHHDSAQPWEGNPRLKSRGVEMIVLEPGRPTWFYRCTQWQKLFKCSTLPTKSPQWLCVTYVQDKIKGGGESQGEIPTNEKLNK